MSTPNIFISYSYDSEEHKTWVRDLAIRLRAAGIDVILDQWELKPGGDLVSFMEGAIRRADRVVMVCTKQYVERADAGNGGVGYERLIISAELAAKIDTRKFIPIIRSGSREVPHFLGKRLYVDFGSNYEQGFDELAREIHAAPLYTKPPIGSNPYSSATSSASRGVSSDSGTSPNGAQLLNDDWFIARSEHSVSKLKSAASMEVRSAVHAPLSKSQLELLTAVRGAEIRTFGWPIGVLIESREEYRPKPQSDGIVAELDVKERPLGGGPSYDYWYLRGAGDFFLLQSLFEDNHDKQAIFFNTRIVRVAETFLFLSRLYTNLGVPSDAKTTVRISHVGLKTRELKSSNRNRPIRGGVSVAGESSAQVTDTIGGLRERVTQHVTQICAPMFMLFDFKEFDYDVYQDIVRRFEIGEVT